MSLDTCKRTHKTVAMNPNESDDDAREAAEFRTALWWLLGGATLLFLILSVMQP